MIHSRTGPRSASALLAGVIMAGATLAIAACGGGEEQTTTAGGGTTTATTETTEAGGGGASVDVSLTEFEVEPSVKSAKAGKITFNVTNDGSADHDLWVLKTDKAADDLPVKGGVADEKVAGVELIDKTAVFGGGESESLTVDLKPGKYVLICNVPGHYTSGMTVGFEVK